MSSFKPKSSRLIHESNCSVINLVFSRCFRSFYFLGSFSFSIFVAFFEKNFRILMFKNAFEAIPVEVMEAARMDKAKNRTIMLKIMVPMISPVIITHFITSFISNWNEYYWVLVMTNSESLRTLPVALRGLLQVDEGVPQWNVAMAGTMIQLAPILLMYIFASGKIKTAMVGDRKIKI